MAGTTLQQLGLLSVQVADRDVRIMANCSPVLHLTLISSTKNSRSKPSLYTLCSRSMFGNTPGVCLASLTSSLSYMHSAVMADRRVSLQLY